jgi:acyl carrier protein
MEKLVFDVVLSVIGDEAMGLTLESDFAVLDVDQLDITYIVLALETRLGTELPTHIEDARTVGELVTGARDALRAYAATKFQLPERNDLPSTLAGRPALRRPPSRRPLWRAAPSCGTKDYRSAPSSSSSSKANRTTLRRPESSSSNSVSPPIDRALERTAAPHLAPDHQLGELPQRTGDTYQIELQPLETKTMSEKPPRLQVSAD